MENNPIAVAHAAHVASEEFAETQYVRTTSRVSFKVYQAVNTIEDLKSILDSVNTFTVDTTIKTRAKLVRF